MHCGCGGGCTCLAGDLENDRRWIKKVVAGGKESEQVPVDKDRLESQHMVVLKKQKFFFVDTAGCVLFYDVRGKGEGGCKCCPEKQQPDVRCRRSAVVFLPYSVASVEVYKQLVEAGVKAESHAESHAEAGA